MRHQKFYLRFVGGTKKNKYVYSTYKLKISNFKYYEQNMAWRNWRKITFFCNKNTNFFASSNVKHANEPMYHYSCIR